MGEAQPVTAEERTAAWNHTLRKMKKWRAPGPDGLPAFLLGAFPRLQTVLWETCDLALQGGGDPQMVGVWQDGDVQEG